MMKTKHTEEDLKLRRLLHRGDPSASRFGLRWAAAVVCVLVLAVVGWQLRDPSAPEAVFDVEEVAAVPDDHGAIEEAADEPTVVGVASDSGDPGSVRDGDASEENLQARTLRFTTRRGTQIIWILDPELEL